jgi:hypothetical protein
MKVTCITSSRSLGHQECLSCMDAVSRGSRPGPLASLNDYLELEIFPGVLRESALHTGNEKLLARASGFWMPQFPSSRTGMAAVGFEQGL